jgi:hypothetical protein
MEWRFYWSNGKSVSRRTALVQIGDDRIILLVQLSAMTRELGVLYCDQSSMICVLPSSTGFPSELKVSIPPYSAPSTTKDGVQRVIESPEIVKLGVNIRGESDPSCRYLSCFFESYRQAMARSYIMTMVF